MSKPTYQDTLDFIFQQLPMYQRDGAKAIKKDLTNITKLCQHLGEPQEKFPSIHIAGTNGKGSTTHFLAAILQETGLRVGLYTSPHYKDYRERIKINGTLVSEKFVSSFVEKNRTLINTMKPSFFEISVAMAFQYFADEKVDIAIIETGLGGRLDSTNILNPILSIITSIGYDHTNFLGDTLEKIAGEKAGIIKENTPVVISKTQAETTDVFINKAKEMNAPIYFAEDSYTAVPTVWAFTHSIYNIYKDKRIYLRDIECDFAGRFQRHNMMGIFQAVEVLQDLGYPSTQEDVRSALGKVIASTGFMGRWHVVKERPMIIADAAHNVDGVKESLVQFKNSRFSHIHFVVGLVKEKDPEEMLSLFPKNASFYFCKPNIPRGLELDILQEAARKIGLKGKTYPSVNDALKAAINAAKRKDCIYVGGSSFVVAEVV